MPSQISSVDPFPFSEFDRWASQYDRDVAFDRFPFTGYARVLAETARLAEVSPGMSVLDLGAGTGNLSALLAPLGCELWCSDYSEKMLSLAREKLPGARCFLHDLRRPFPPELDRSFDRIVSAYVFHHFEVAEKLAIVDSLVNDHLPPRGRLVIADISFPTAAAKDAMQRAAGEEWEEEPYWIASEALPGLIGIDPDAAYFQISDCAGIYLISIRDKAH